MNISTKDYRQREDIVPDKFIHPINENTKGEFSKIFERLSGVPIGSVFKKSSKSN